PHTWHLAPAFRNPSAVPVVSFHLLMDCLELRERYADIRDGLISAPRERRRFQRHLAQCATCREWEAALQRGVRALQATLIEPSPEFRSRLEARLLRGRPRPPRPKRRVRAGRAAAPF